MRTHRTSTSRSVPRVARVVVAVLAAMVALAMAAVLAWFVTSRTWSAPSGDTRRPITVVGIGDSVTAGSNCGCEAFVQLYAAGLASKRGLRISGVNLGAEGLTSSQLLESLNQPGDLRDSVTQADILLVTIGANDLLPLTAQWQSGGCSATCYAPAVMTVGHNVQGIVAAARSVRPGHPSTVLVMSYWNVFQDGDVGTAQRGGPFERWSDRLTRAVDAQICEGAQRAGATCVDLYKPFKGDGSKNPTSLLASDGDHPSASGHQLIASTLLVDTPARIP